MYNSKKKFMKSDCEDWIAERRVKFMMLSLRFGKDQYIFYSLLIIWKEKLIDGIHMGKSNFYRIWKKNHLEFRVLISAFAHL